MPPTKTLKQAKRKERWMDILFLGPQLCLYLLFTIIPLLIAIPIVFSDKLSIADVDYNFIGFKNFITIFQGTLGESFLKGVRRTSVFTLFNYLMVYVFGFSLALLMYESKSKIKSLFFAVIYLPWIVSGVGLGAMVIMLLSRDFGALNLILVKYGFLSKAIDIKTEAAITFFLPLLIGWRAAGFNMALFLSGLLTIPEDTISAAQVDGTNYVQRVWYIYIPQMVPSIIIATTFCLIGSFGVFDELIGMGALYGNEAAEFFSVVLYRTGLSATQGAVGTFGEAMTMAVVVYVPLVLVAFGLNKLQKKLQY